MTVHRRRTHSARWFGVALAMLLGVCPPAFAQRPRPDRPYRGLFGGNGADPSSNQQFDLNGSLSGAYDDNVLADRGQGAVNPQYQRSGAFANGSLSLDYTRRVGGSSIDVSGGSSYRYYPSLKEMNGASYFLSVGASIKLGGKTTLRLTESGSYTPYFSYGLFAAQEAGTVYPIDPQQALSNLSAVMAYSSASLERRLTPRASVSADYSFDYSEYSSRARPFKNTGAGATFRYRLTPRSGFRAGYHYRRSTLGYYATWDEPIETHDLDIGIDYTRPLSRSRKTMFGFSTGSTIYTVAESSSSTGVNAGPIPNDLTRKNRYTVTGSAFLTRQIGRSWVANLNYRRGLQLVAGFGDPFFADTVSLSVDGFAGARSRLRFNAGYSKGQLGVTLMNNRYSTTTGSASYQLAMTRWCAAFVQYDYYHYLFDQGVSLPIGMGRGLDRNSIRAGVNLWAPLLR